MLAPGSKIDTYEILEEVGSGGMARVLKVRHLVLGSLHALKVLDAELVANQQIRQRFLAEGRIQASLRHPNIARITDTVVQPGIAGLIVDFIDGEPLDRNIAARKRAPTGDEVRALFAPLLEALGYAHAQGIVHRDIKPSNIVLSRDHSGALHPVIVDFGIAKVLDPDGGDGAKGKTRTGARLGTANYMSPEQIRSPGKVDHRADLFSLAATMYEFATLTVPFEADSDFDVMANIVAGNLAPPRDLVATLDADLGECIATGLAPDLERRYASAEAFSVALVSNHVPSPRLATRPLGRVGSRAALAPTIITSSALGAELCVIPPGKFVMGSPDSEPGRSSNEVQHEVTITRRYAMLRTPVTRAMWQEVMKGDPYASNRIPSTPVANVSWFDAVAFCNHLSVREGLEPAYETTQEWFGLLKGTRLRGFDVVGYRLPTEAEWEYAARAGTATAYWSGASEADLDRVGWYARNSGGGAHGVAEKVANAWGLYDVHGSVWEWVNDGYSVNTLCPADPARPLRGPRVARGGSWINSARCTRAASRSRWSPYHRATILGFRFVRSLAN